MTANTEEDEAIVLALVAGSEEERKDALDRAYTAHQKQVFNYIVFRAPGLPTDTQLTALQETFQSLFRATTAANFDSNKPLVPLLLTLAYRRAVDELRHFETRRRFEEQALDDGGFAAEVSIYLIGTKVADTWRSVVDRERVHNLQHLFRSLVPGLPPAQRHVAQVMADAFPGRLTDRELVVAVEALSGAPTTVAAVRSARDEVREKFSQLLHAEK